MSLWEYKVITSGKGGFATPALLEKFLNDLGRDEWEIIHFQTPPDNFLAFTGLVRRSTQRDWTLEDAAAAAAKAEAEKLRAEFEAKFKAANQPSAASAEERAPSFLEEKAAPDDGFRKPVDTSRDDDPEVDDDKADEWDKLTAEEDELPTFFDAIKPHLRRNQRGPGMSVGVEYLAKKWDQSEDDLKGALAECGFVMPVDEDSKAEYLEYDGDLYWLNINRRGELWINTKEKPRPVFRAVKAQKVVIEEPTSAKSETGDRKPETGAEKAEGGEQTAEAGSGKAETEGQPESSQAESRSSKSANPSAPLPEGAALLQKIRPHMRRNRRGPGGSGSSSFLARALRSNEADLRAAFVGLGLTLPTSPTDKPVYTELGNELWWLNLDSRGGLWINGREKKNGETAASASAAAPAPDAGASVEAREVAPVPAEVTTGASATAASGNEATPESPAPASESSSPAPSPEVTASAPQATEAAAPTASPAPAADAPTHPALEGVRALLKETRSGSLGGKIDRLAEELGRTSDEVLATLVETGMKVPEKPREKAVSVPHGSEILWLSRNARGELWLNAKPAKLASKDDADEESGDAESEGDDDKPRRGRSRKKESSEAPADGTQG